MANSLALFSSLCFPCLLHFLVFPFICNISVHYIHCNKASGLQLDFDVFSLSFWFKQPFFRLHCLSVFSLSLCLFCLSVMSASCSLIRNSHFFWSPTPFSTPLSSPRARNLAGDDLLYIEILIHQVSMPNGVTGPVPDWGGILGPLADEVADAVHLPHCGCYWCNRRCRVSVPLHRSSC